LHTGGTLRSRSSYLSRSSETTLTQVSGLHLGEPSNREKYGLQLFSLKRELLA